MVKSLISLIFDQIFKMYIDHVNKYSIAMSLELQVILDDLFLYLVRGINKQDQNRLESGLLVLQ